MNGHAAIQVKSRPEIKRYPCKVLKEAAGEDISHAMMDYFKRLMSWLEEQNKGRPMGGSSREQRVKDCAFQSNGHPSGLLFFLAGMVMGDLYARTTSTDRWPYSIPAQQDGVVGSERVSETGRPALERLVLLVRLKRILIAICLVHEECIVVLGIAINVEPNRSRLAVSTNLAIPLQKLKQLLILAWPRFDPKYDSEHE